MFGELGSDIAELGSNIWGAWFQYVWSSVPRAMDFGPEPPKYKVYGPSSPCQTVARKLIAVDSGQSVDKQVGTWNLGATFVQDSCGVAAGQSSSNVSGFDLCNIHI